MMRKFDIIYLKKLIEEISENDQEEIRKLLESKLDNRTLSRLMVEASIELKNMNQQYEN